jgi:hypothetical protein
LKALGRFNSESIRLREIMNMYVVSAMALQNVDRTLFMCRIARPYPKEQAAPLEMFVDAVGPNSVNKTTEHCAEHPAG